MSDYIIGNLGCVGQVPQGRWFLLNGRFFKHLKYPYTDIEDPSFLLDARTNQPSFSHQNCILVQVANGGLYFAECSDECKFMEPER